MPETSEPAPTAEGAASDDIVLPFATQRSRVIGRLVRLGAVTDEILTRHDYPDPIRKCLGHAIVLTALVGASLKFDGRLILQTSGDGPLNMLVTNYETSGHLRGYASFNREALAANPMLALREGSLLGKGHFAMTIDPGSDMNRYQGIVPLEGQSLTHAALTYFQQSEQLPTFIRLAVQRDAASGRWRGGGIIVQHVAPEGGHQRGSDEEEVMAIAGDRDENWQRVRLLAATVEERELTDAALSPERLLYRLFHEEGVRAGTARSLATYCRCSRERIADFLTQFGPDQLDDMREDDGGVTVTCEFCSTRYAFAPSEVGRLQ